MTIAEPAPAATDGRRHPHRLPHLPAVRGELRPRDHAAAHRRRRRGGRAHPRRPRRRVQPGLHLPQGLHPQAAPRGPRPAAPPAREARRRVRRGRAGTRPSPRSSARLLPVLEEHGRDAAAVYIGNPNAHNLAGMLYNQAVLRALGTTNVFSASTVDQRPKEISAALMFGGGLNVPVPDVDRTDHLLMLGANPFASNGSLATAPDWPGRLERLVERGGTLVVVDPRRSRTAEMATEWVPIRPGADAYLLMAMVQVITSEGLVDLGTCADLVTGLDEVVAAAAPFTPEAVAAGHRARRRRRSAGWPASWPPRPPPASTAASAPPPPSSARSRRGWSTCSTCSPATSTGPAAPCSPRPPPAPATRAASRAYGREVQPPPPHAAACASCPRPSASSRPSCMAEEMDTPGEGQIRALVTVAGNPVLSTPNSARLDAALAEPRVHGVGRHLRQRDHPPRRRDPPGAVRAAEGPLRPRAPPARAARHGQLQRAGAAARRRTSPTSGRCWPGSPSCCRAPAPRPTRRWSTT